MGGRTEEMSAMVVVQDFLDGNTSYSGWGAEFAILRLLSASAWPAKTVFEFQVKSNHTNGLNNLHGGCTATLFDWCTTTALIPISKSGFWHYKGVSRTLNVTYFRPIPVGEVIIIESEVVHIGKRLCTIKGVMRRKSDGAVVTTCEHGKVNIDPDVSSGL